MTSLKVSSVFLILCLSMLSLAQEDTYKEVTLEKYKLQNKIKNLLLKSNEAQKNILFLEEEINEMNNRVVYINEEKIKISDNIKKNFNAFSNELIKFKNNDSSYVNLIRLKTFMNWNNEFARVKDLTIDLEKTNETLIKTKKEMRSSIVSANSLMLQVNSEVDELDTLQKYLRTDLEKSGPDSDFFNLNQRLRWPIAKGNIIASKGFYKIPGERVYDYNEGLKFSAERGEPVYPIASGILEGEIYVPNLGQILIVKHTENIRSFYIGATTIPGVLINDTLSPDRQFGLVKSPVLELKLRFDTESLDPSEWVKYRR
jgi:murein DD-endopeptidase MepM/ murein hydrolase activator NlpD